ncbi:hypothetical protein [Paraburkholderia sp. ZP32-5]|uniref:hypothetical protein n=1 Tax=Paraburkholderia sp. ZP32-5 TaxID=2883245 RepID=UPI001F2984BA|nr:hypothetical protein [Paraburkholderia sp. ZP32-5]
MLGIESDSHLIYEGSYSLWGHAIWPSPFISIASYIGPHIDWNDSPHSDTLTSATMLFREDSFDPVARIRRGRLYKRWADVQPATWHVQRHPAYASAPAATDARGFLVKQLYSFQPWSAPELLLAKRREAVLILGSGSRVAAYTVLDIERLATGEDLITARTRASLGVLPDIEPIHAKDQHVALAMEQYEKAASSAFRDSAESVIDRCREAATAAITAHLANTKSGNSSLGKDLAVLADAVDPPHKPREERRLVLGNAARIIARLHSQGKAAERVQRGNNAPSESDAECALALLGKIYREIGWA